MGVPEWGQSGVVTLNIATISQCHRVLYSPPHTITHLQTHYAEKMESTFFCKACYTYLCCFLIFSLFLFSGNSDTKHHTLLVQNPIVFLSVLFDYIPI